MYEFRWLEIVDIEPGDMIVKVSYGSETLNDILLLVVGFYISEGDSRDRNTEYQLKCLNKTGRVQEYYFYDGTEAKINIKHASPRWKLTHSMSPNTR